VNTLTNTSRIHKTVSKKWTEAEAGFLGDSGKWEDQGEDGETKNTLSLKEQV
jgi:hypothetical protein